MRFTKPLKLLLIAGVSAVCVANASAQSAEAEYSAILSQIADMQISIAHKEAHVAYQEAELANLQAQSDRLEETKAAIPAILEKMAAGIEREVAADYPFDKDNRTARIASLKQTVADPTASPAEKYRKALNVYKIEINFGASIDAYKGDHPINPTFREGDDRFAKDENGDILVDKNTGLPVQVFDGNYMRYGRTAFAYLNNDGSDALRYDLATGEWVPMTKNEALQIRRGVRVAKGEIAPNVIYAPVVPES